MVTFQVDLVKSAIRVGFGKCLRRVLIVVAVSDFIRRSIESEEDRTQEQVSFSI